MSNLDFRLGTGALKYEEELGIAAWLMSRSRQYQLFQLACITLWIEPAIRHRQILFVFNEYEKPIGYCTWAFLAPDVEKRWLHDPQVLLHECEWNEGNNLWIMDFCAPLGRVPEILRHLRTEMFPEHDSAFSVRRDRDGSVKKTSQWIRAKPPSPSVEM